MPTFAEYLEKWLKQSTAQGLTNPLVKMPVKRFRLLLPHELGSLANGGSLIIGSVSEPIPRNLLKNYLTRIRERGEHCAFICSGSVEIIVSGGTDGKQRKQLFPVSLKRASLEAAGDKVRAVVGEEDLWILNPVLQAQLRGLTISVPASIASEPVQATNWVRSQLGNRASQVTSDSYVGLFSSQQMVVHNRLCEPLLRQALAKNAVIRAKIAGTKIESVDFGETTDDNIEELGLVLPCDDSQLRVIQLSDSGHCLQVEGPPGTGKSQTIANIISNALHHGRNVLLVCDKQEAINQVEKRLSDVGLSPALLNLHDDGLKRGDFLKQAINRFPAAQTSRLYPFGQLKESRKTLNERVRFARGIAHPSLQVTKREAVSGMIRLRSELRSVPNIPIANWQALSKDRFNKLLACLGEWPGLCEVLTDNVNIWNAARVESFDNDPNTEFTLPNTISGIRQQLESLQRLEELAATIGIEFAINSDASVAKLMELVAAVLDRPPCHPQILGNQNLSVLEVEYLRLQWERRDQLVAARHPVILSKLHADGTELSAHRSAELMAEELLYAEGATTWEDLSRRVDYHAEKRSEIEASQRAYRRLCDQIGLVYSPLLKVRRAQLQAVLSLAALSTTVPRGWWKSDTTPVHTLASWKSHLQACSHHAKKSPVPLDFVALERIAGTHWHYVQAKAEHGFNVVSYCVHFVNDRKCKYALCQVFPDARSRGFNRWREITLHAVSALNAVQSLRSAADAHVRLSAMTSAYLVAPYESSQQADKYLSGEDVQSLEKMAIEVERMRDRNDLYEIRSAHWQAFWENTNSSLLEAVKTLLSGFDALVLPTEQQSDNVEDALGAYGASQERIRLFLSEREQQSGDRSNSVMEAFSAQRNFADCELKLTQLSKYLCLQTKSDSQPDWQLLKKVILWRDNFERLRGQQKLDVDSGLWATLVGRLKEHQRTMAQAYDELEKLFEIPWAGLVDYAVLEMRLAQLLSEFPRRGLWIEKRRWQLKIAAFPELSSLWARILDGTVKATDGQRLFCFNLLKLCDPMSKPHGLEFKQVLKEFTEQDEQLAMWVIDHLKLSLREKMEKGAQLASKSEAELKRLAGLQRIRGTVRELANAHLDYLVAAKPCWLMSPTSLANLIDSKIFDEHGVPFDLVIFDEASQIRVLDGLLSMAFGKQVIIVGDKNQLPPTEFFAGFAGSEDESEDFGISESLLDEFGGVFEEARTQVMLMSHYRSETPDLISFSNRWFYADKLEIYPPAHVSGVGRRLHYVPNAVYSESGHRNNPAEAREVVKLIESHVRDHPDKSLGVVTMNIPQMELIEEQLLQVSDQVRAFCSEESRFFLRNLETVQGDEMDRIILSMTYGKNSAGHFNASVLGPLTKAGGERRLNVAITRSRSGLTIVSSLRAADLEATSAQSRGFQCLKDFLFELENTEQALTFGVGSKKFTSKSDGVSNVVYCESPFEEQVVEFLENEGYELECQYGAGKFRIDIVIKERGKNILAIECDGAAYHSSLCARTRDRARHRKLEQLGWRIHRVWSTNWWYFEQQEKEGIVAAIASARRR